MELLLMLAAAWVLCAPLVLIVWVARHGERLRAAEERATQLERELRRLRAVQPATAAEAATLLSALAPERQPQPLAERSPNQEPDSVPAAQPSASQEAEGAERRFVPPPSTPGPQRTPLRESPARPGIDWERWLGVRGAAVVGGVALALAGLFFVQLAIQRGWIGPALRDGIAVAAGALGLGAFTPLQRRGYHAQAAALGGAGTVLIYLGAWAAARVHGLVPAWLAFGAMTGTTIVAGHLAVRAVAPVLAAFALVGGFATPLLLDIGARSTGALFSYLALLNLAALTMGTKPGWSWVPRVSVGATAVVQLVWYMPALLGGAAAPRPSWATLAALLSVPFVHAIATRFAAGMASVRSSSLAASASIVLQVLFAAHLGVDLEADATLWPIGAFGLVLAVLSGWIGRKLGVLHAPALGALGGIAVLAVWTELHPARRGSDAAASGALLDQFAICAAVLIAALAFFELRTSTLPKRALGAFSAALAALLVLLGFVQDLGPNADSLHTSLAAVTFAALGLAAIGGGSLRLYAGLPIGAIVGLTLTAVTAAEALEPRAHSLALSYLLGATALGTLATLRWSGVGTAVLGCAAAGLVRIAITVPGVLVFPAFGLAVCAGIATFFVRRGADAKEQNQDRSIDFGIGGLSFSAAFFAVVWLAEAAFERIVPTATESLLLVAIALPVPLGLALGPSRRLALSAWMTSLPALAALSPALGVLAERVGGLRVHAQWLAAAAVPFAVAGAVALARRQRQLLQRSDWAALAAPLCAAAGMLSAAALARAVGPNARIVTVALGGTFMALTGLWLARRDVGGLGALLGVLGTFAFVSVGLDGSVLPREAALIPPKLTWTALTVIAGAAVVKPAFGAGLSGVLQLLVAFCWLNLVVVNHFTTGATIALQETRAAERDLTLSAAWLGFAAVLLTIGMWRQSRGLRWASLAVLIATVFKVFLYDLSALEGGERALSFLGLAVALFAVSLIYQRWVLPTRRATAPSSAKMPPSTMTDTPTM